MPPVVCYHSLSLLAAPGGVGCNVRQLFEGPEWWRGPLFSWYTGFTDNDSSSIRMENEGNLENEPFRWEHTRGSWVSAVVMES